MAKAIYVLCALTSLIATILLWRGFIRTRTRLLFWSGVCFALLTVNNVILYVDMVVLPDTDLSLLRNSTALLSMLVMLFGLVWEKR
jgi:hypothetical protein